MIKREPKPISRGLARERGLARYFTGKPCKHGHVAERLLSNGDCIVCATLIGGLVGKLDVLRIECPTCGRHG